MSELNSKNSKKLSLFGFFTFTSAMVMSVYVYPTFATAGFSLVFFLVLGGILWFIPVALCSAEMATVEGWKDGGIFTWISNTLGERWGFAGIFLQWFQITIGFIPMLYFILGAFSYAFNWPALNENPIIKFIAMLIVFWGVTFSQLGGTKWTVKIAKIGFIFGIVIPIILLIFLSGTYLLKGNPIDLNISLKTAFPNFKNINTLVIFVSFLLSYVGIEASATHVNQMESPKRDYPIAVLMLCGVAMLCNTVAGLSIGAVVPVDKLNLSTGVIQAFQYLFNYFSKGLNWAVVVISLILPLSTIAKVSTWIVGPSEGIYLSAKKGLLPKIFTKVNEHNVPTPLIMVQGIVVSIWAAILTLGGKGNNLSFFISVSLTVAIYLAAYLIFFIAYFVLVFKHGDLKRAYQVPGGEIFKAIVAGIGFLTSLFALVISFFPPSQFNTQSEAKTYETILIISFIIGVILPFIIYEFHSDKQYVIIKKIRNDKNEIYKLANRNLEVIKEIAPTLEEKVGNEVKSIEYKIDKKHLKHHDEDNKY